MSRRLLPLLILVGCADPVPPADHPDTRAPELDPIPLVTDRCDDASYTGMTWKSVSSPHFTINYLPGTPAEADRIKIDLRLEDAYTDIRSNLGITAEPSITVNLSPNRAAATEKRYGLGVGWAGWDRYDASYTGS